MSTYKIVNFDETTGQLIIEYAIGMATIAIDVPIENGLYITGEALDNYIKGFIPTWHVERMQQISAGIANKDELKALVTQSDVPLVDLTPEQIASQESSDMWQQLQTEQLIAKALVKFGVLASDPTEIPVSAQ